MLELAYALHEGSLAFIMVVTSLGVGLSAGASSQAALDAIDFQPSSFAEIFKLSTMGIILIETSAIIGLIMTYMLIGTLNAEFALAQSIAHVGIALAVGVTGFMVSKMSRLPIQAATMSAARQPFFNQQILNLLIITLALVQTPMIFGFVIGMLIKLQIPSLTNIADAYRLLASGMCIGIGSIGPSIGLARFSQTACASVGLNKNAYSMILPFTFISGVIIETPLVFSLITAGLILGIPLQDHLSYVKVIGLIGAAFCTSVGTISPSINSSRTASAACVQITQHPEQYAVLSQVSVISQALIDAVAIYALSISILLILF